jgi:chromosome segregation ATPase
VAPLLDQLLLPQRLAARAIEDLRRIADAAVSIGALAGELRPAVGPVMKWAQHVDATLESLRDELTGLRGSLEPMSEDLDALRAAFAGSNEQLARLRESVVPELGGVRVAAEGLHEEVRRQRELIDALDTHLEEMGQLLAGRLSALLDTLKPLARDADELREVVQPLQTATERVGRLAERLPGPGRKRKDPPLQPSNDPGAIASSSDISARSSGLMLNGTTPSTSGQRSQNSLR